MKLCYGKFTARNSGLAYFQIVETQIVEEKELSIIQLYSVDVDKNTVKKGDKIFATIYDYEEIELENPHVQ